MKEREKHCINKKWPLKENAIGIVYNDQQKKFFCQNQHSELIMVSSNLTFSYVKDLFLIF